MFGHARTAVKFFVYGLLIGLFFAPKSGAETRAEAIDWAMSSIKKVMGSVDS